MKATHIFETVIYASDLAAAERFYSEVLGLEVISRFGVALAFRCEGGVLLIFDPAKSSLPGRDVPSHGPHGPGTWPSPPRPTNSTAGAPSYRLMAWPSRWRSTGNRAVRRSTSATRRVTASSWPRRRCGGLYIDGENISRL